MTYHVCNSCTYIDQCISVLCSMLHVMPCLLGVCFLFVDKVKDSKWHKQWYELCSKESQSTLTEGRFPCNESIHIDMSRVRTNHNLHWREGESTFWKSATPYQHLLAVMISRACLSLQGINLQSWAAVQRIRHYFVLTCAYFCHCFRDTQSGQT